MKKPMTRRFAGVVALSMTLTTAAFADPVGSFPNAKLTLSRWAGDPWTAAQVKAADKWSTATTAKLTIDAIPYENLHDKQQLEMANGTYDIMYVHPGWFGEYAAAGALLPIDNYLSDVEQESTRLLSRLLPARRTVAGRLRRQAVLSAGFRFDRRSRLSQGLV